MKTVVALCLASLLSTLSFAGVLVQYESSGGKGDAHQGTLYLEKDRLRAEASGPVAIFRGDKEVVWILDSAKSSYREIDKKQMAEVGDKAASAMAEMKKQLEKVPPAQRAMVEKMMAGKLGTSGSGGDAKPARTFKKTGKTETINGWPCVSYDAMRGDEREQELWVTDWKQLDLTAADFKALQEFGEFLNSLVGPIAKQFSFGLDQKLADRELPDALPGVPIRTISFHDGKQTVSELKKISREAIPATKFEVPSGYKKEAMGIGGS